MVSVCIQATHFVSARVNISYLSCSFCVQTNYFPSYFDICIYVPRRLWSCFFSPELYKKTSPYTRFIQCHDIIFSNKCWRRK